MPAMLRRLFRGGAAAPGWLAFEFGERKVSVAHVRPNAERSEVLFAEEREWDPAEPKSLERVAREFDAHRYRCTTLLRPSEYQVLLVEAPVVKPDELKAAVRWRIKDLIDYHVDDATIDVLDVPMPANAAQRARSIYVVAARTETIRGVVQRFDSAKIPLAVIDIPDAAQRNIATRFEAGGRAVVMLAFDDEGGLLTVNFNGELYLSRRLDVVVGQFGEAGEEERGRLLDRVLVETQRSLDHCERTYPFFSLGRLILGPLPEGTGLREHLAANLYLPVEGIDLAQAVSLPAGAGWNSAEQARWLRLVGAGMRVEARAL
jgi:MSHA biogenesis protein MshI